MPFSCRPIRPIRFSWRVRLSWWRKQSSHENLTLGRILPDGRLPSLARVRPALLRAGRHDRRLGGRHFAWTADGWTSGGQSQDVLLSGRWISALPCCGRTERWMEISATWCSPRGSIFSSLEQSSFRSPLRLHFGARKSSGQQPELSVNQQGSPHRQSIRIALADLKMSGCKVPSSPRLPRASPDSQRPHLQLPVIWRRWTLKRPSSACNCPSAASSVNFWIHPICGVTIGVCWLRDWA